MTTRVSIPEVRAQILPIGYGFSRLKVREENEKDNGNVRKLPPGVWL